MSVSVEYIKNVNFSQLSMQEKIEIKNKGRPTPDIIITQEGISNNKKYIRSFNKEWYQKIKWLCGCEIKNALFCFPCLLFGNDTVWTKRGFKNISKIKEKCEKHENSKNHLENIISLSFLGKVKPLSETHTVSKLKHNEAVKNNREILSKIIDYIKFCGKFVISIWEHCETYLFKYTGVIESLLNCGEHFNPSLQKHLDSNEVFKGKSEAIQNELLHCMLAVCRDHIVSEINETSYVAIMVSDATDISEQMQTVIVFRYVLHGIIHERFWGFFAPENQISNGFTKCLLNELCTVLNNDSGKLIAQTYDCEQDEVQYNIQENFPYAYYIHCYAHHLNIITKHVSCAIKSVRIFFANLSGIADFFFKSPQRLAVLEKYCEARLPKSSNTLWDFNTINMIHENKNCFILCFKELQSLKTTDEIIQASSGFLSLLKDESFLFWLRLFHKIMPHVDILYNQMQSRNVDAVKIQRALHKFSEAILKIRNSENCESPNTFQMIESKEVCDRIIAEVEERFMFTNHLNAVKLFCQENFKHFHKNLPTFDIIATCTVYPFVIQEKLETELRIFYSQPEFHKFNGLLSLLNTLNVENLASVFSEIIKLLKILVTIPMITAESERCFSTLKKVKSYLINTVNQEKVTALCMISVENDMISEITNFNEKVIEKFCQSEQKNGFLFKSI